VADADLLPVVTDVVADGDRVRAVGRLQDLVGSGQLEVDRFSAALEEVLAAQTHTNLETAMAALPSLVRMTPATRRLVQPLNINAGMGRLDLGAGWQLASETSVRTDSGRCRLDLTQASWDACEIDLDMQTVMGTIEVIVPEGVAIQMLSARGSVKLHSLAPPVPGAPLLRVTAVGISGEIRIRNPTRPRRWRPRRWRRSRHQRD
jgi:hypothetical protein